MTYASPILRFSLLTLGALAVLGLSACSNTVEGVGKDVEHSGQAIQKTFSK